MKRLKDKVAIITGGGGGIGKGIALRFASEGAKTVIVNRSEKGKNTAEEIRRAGGEALWISTDVGRTDQVKKMVKQTLDAYGRVDVLVNNAAVQYLQPIWELSEEAFDQMLQTNLGGYFRCAKYIIPHMMTEKSGVIINVSSNLAFRALAGFAGYSATKGGIVSMSRTMALECAPHGIRVNCICPGSTITPIMEPILNQFKDPPAVLDAAASVMPVGRLAKPADIAALAVFLASDEAEMIAGETITMDGGNSIYLPTVDTSGFEKADQIGGHADE